MAKIYLVLLNRFFDREAVVNYLDTVPQIQSWQMSFPYSFFVKTDMTAMGVFSLIIKQFPVTSDDHNIYVVLVSGESFGLLPEGHWKWLGKNEVRFSDDFKKRLEGK